MIFAIYHIHDNNGENPLGHIKQRDDTYARTIVVRKRKIDA